MKKAIFFDLFVAGVILLFFVGCRKNPPVEKKPPLCTSNTAPFNGANVSSASVVLSWSPATGAISYDVYVGSSVANAVKVGSVTAITYNYTIPPSGNATFYWYVVPKNASGSATGCTTSATSFKRIFIVVPPVLNSPLITYFPSYRYVAEYSNSMFAICDVVNYAFADVNSNGTITIANLSRFDSVYQKAKANGAKVFISLAGAANFASVTSSAAGRNNLIKDIMRKVRQHNLDGVDVDWEYPRTSDGTHEYFAALMKELSDSLHVDAKYYLATAITPGIYSGSVRDGIKTEVFNYVDIFHIMAYDDFTTDPQYPFKQHSSLATATASLNYWLNTRGMPKEKCVLGIPAYGRNSGAAQISSSYKNILANGTQLGPAPLHESDSARMTKTDGSVFTTYYNGMFTAVNKTILAKTRCNGVFFWEMGHDTNDQFSLHKAAAIELGKTP